MTPLVTPTQVLGPHVAALRTQAPPSGLYPAKQTKLQTSLGQEANLAKAGVGQLLVVQRALGTQPPSERGMWVRTDVARSETSGAH